MKILMYEFLLQLMCYSFVFSVSEVLLSGSLSFFPLDKLLHISTIQIRIRKGQIMVFSYNAAEIARRVIS